MVSCYAMGDKPKKTSDLHRNEGLKHAPKTGKSDSAPEVMDDNSLILNPVLHVQCDTANLHQGTTGLCRAGPTGGGKNVTVPFTLEACPEIIGDEIERTVVCKGGSDLNSLSGKAVGMRVVLKDADLYSIRFHRHGDGARYDETRFPPVASVGRPLLSQRHSPQPNGG